MLVAPTGVFSLCHCGVFADVVIAGIDPDGGVHDAVHGCIGLDHGAEPLMPILLGVLRAEHGESCVVPAFE